MTRSQSQLGHLEPKSKELYENLKKGIILSESFDKGILSKYEETIISEAVNCNESGVSLVALAIKKNQIFDSYFENLIDYANEQSIDESLFLAIRAGNQRLILKILENPRFEKELSPDQKNKEDLNVHDFMVAACTLKSRIYCFEKTHADSNNISEKETIELLFKSGFRLNDKNADLRYPNHQDRAVDYFYSKLLGYKAQSHPVYLILQAEEKKMRIDNLEADFLKNEGQQITFPQGKHMDQKNAPSIYSDDSIFGIIIELIRKIRVAKKETNMYISDYEDIENHLQHFMIQIIEQVQNDDDSAKLLKLGKNYNNPNCFYDREYVPLLKYICDLEMKIVSNAKPFQGMLDYLFNRYLDWWPKNFIGSILMFFVGMCYPLLTLSFLIFPSHWRLAKFSHYPRVAYNCEAASEIYYLVIILIYPYIIGNSTSFLIYNIILSLFALSKFFKELQEIKRRTFTFYWKDMYNIIDWFEILFLTIIVICRYITIGRNTDPFSVVDPPVYSVTLRIADGLFFWIPIFITLRLLLLFRVFRNIGLLQISFSKMFDDIFAWLAILITILIGFSISFNLLGLVLFNQNLTDPANSSVNPITGECSGTVFNRASTNMLDALWEFAWIMFTGPENDDLQAIRACFGFDWFLHVTAYLLMAAFALMLIVVLVNLLIAMMSKTFDKVCDDEVREIEWTFHMMNLNTKFIRRDFVAPVPMNLFPHLYKHCYSEHAMVRKIFNGESSQVSDADNYNEKDVGSQKGTVTRTVDSYAKSLKTNFVLEISEAEVLQRNDDYNEVVAELIRRYRRKYL